MIVCAVACGVMVIPMYLVVVGTMGRVASSRS